jgi:hypothetical protein
MATRNSTRRDNVTRRGNTGTKRMLRSYRQIGTAAVHRRTAGELLIGIDRGTRAGAIDLQPVPPTASASEDVLSSGVRAATPAHPP